MLNKLREEILTICEQLEIELFDLEYVKEGKDYILRVLIDKAGGIDLDALVSANEKISEMLDKVDPFKEEYMLEVASPGAERPIRNEQEVTDAVGRYVFVKTFDQSYYGDLLSFADGNIMLKTNDKGRIKNISIPYVDVQSMRIAIKF